MTIENDLRKSMAEEALAAADYRGRAASARAGGDEITAGLWDHIAGEEDGHYNEFEDRLIYVMTAKSSEGSEPVKRAREVLDRISASLDVGALHRPFPQTNEDWENLGFDIEAKLPLGSVERSLPGAYVAIITGRVEGDADAAKRWLVQKAGELGID